MSLLSSSARSLLDAKKQHRFRPVSEVPDIETWFGLAGRYVDPTVQHSRRQYVGFIRDLVKAGSVWFVKMLLSTLVFFFVAKKAGAQRSIIDARASNLHFFETSIRPLLTGEGLCHVEFQGTTENAENWSDIKNPFYQMRIPSWLRLFLHCPLFLQPKMFAQEK